MATRDAPLSLSLLFIDVDHFKQVNDRHGHPVGDAVLQRVARIMADVVRRPIDLVARYAGDEFVILLPDTPAAGAEEIAQLLSDRVDSTLNAVRVEGQILPVSLSIGSATLIPGPGMSHDELLRRADAALYDAKREGRHCARAWKADA